MANSGAHEYPENSPPLSPTHTTHPFSHHTPSHPPNIFKLTPYPCSPLKTCGMNPLLALLAWYLTKISVLFRIFHLLITPRTLPHTLYARSMSWPSLSHTSVPNHTLSYNETVNLCPCPGTPSILLSRASHSWLETAKKRLKIWNQPDYSFFLKLLSNFKTQAFSRHKNTTFFSFLTK